jgi:hypothetical protein
MRIVLDTNVLARAVRGGIGPAAELLGIVMVPPHVFTSHHSFLPSFVDHWS